MSGKIATLVSQILEENLNEHFLGMTAISEGDSQQVFKVSTNDENYVAKFFSQVPNFERERNFLEIGLPITPKLIGCRDCCIVMEYINSPMLGRKTFTEEDLLKQLLLAFNDFHRESKIVQLRQWIEVLDFSETIRSLANSCHLNAEQTRVVDQLVRQATELDNLPSINTLCHGDFNQFNVFSDSGRYKIIDFESLTVAPRLYDLMMLLSINQFSVDHIAIALAFFENNKHNPITKDEYSQAQQYFLIATGINGLWYLAKYQESESQEFGKKANHFLDQLTFLIDNY
ncbi:hypothetical protein tloyanaT_26620 [Thalassotalea loyana]|uniref:Aminoglycoside phosphotransferase domain-containing protein n=1 Tax=Thalassotalea loyana TaxID=280483 RepID=A0ABQ6HFP1_9GAMM|nr:aminoglycoside phosphotransferase family protein [Thalassotalea loyana]GLX86409.1 hypothetical protein tloyanaT_26620 [Thalassotalea loyana]